MAVARSQKVFVVDDEPIIAKTLAAILVNAGLDAEAFYRPEAALEAAVKSAPNLLITDVVMPGMTGIELAILMRDKCPACKTLLFSGQAATADLLAKAKEEGHDFEILQKPIHPADLLAKLLSL